MRVLITGASRGIGAALANGLRARGDDVIGTARGPSAEWQLDVADPTSQAELASRLAGTSLDVVVCNAGVYLDKGQDLATGYPAQMWADSFAVNVTGVFLTVQTLLPNLKRAQTPKIAIISSQMASHTRAPGGGYIYRASKAAALNIGRNLSSELAKDGVAVGIYHPGWVRTDMGGGTADLSVEEAAEGLIARIDNLSMDTTGCFQTWDGRDHPY